MLSAVSHPAEPPQLPSDLEFSVHCLETCSAADIASKRCNFLHGVLQRASELASLARVFHAGLAPHCRRVLEGKRLLLLKELLHGLGHEDSSLVIKTVSAASFCPDGTRSGRWQDCIRVCDSASVVSSPSHGLNRSAGSSASGIALGSDTAPDLLVAEDSSSSSGSELASEDSCDEDEQQVAAAPHFLENLLSLGGYAVAKNKSSRLQHVLEQESGRLLCGKPFTDNFAVSASVDGSASSCRTCKTCGLATVCVSGTSHHRGHLTASVLHCLHLSALGLRHL